MDYGKKRTLIISISLFLLLLFYLFKNLSDSIKVFGFIFGIFIFYFSDHLFEINFKLRHYFYAIAILAFGILLSPLYFLLSIYDKVLHVISPILACILMFYVIDKKDLNIQWKLGIVFMFVISFLTFHEIGEYLIDQLLGLKLQGVYLRGSLAGTEKLNLIMSKIDDTMIDLIVGTIGASLFVFWKGTVYWIKNKGKIKKK